MVSPFQPYSPGIFILNEPFVLAEKYYIVILTPQTSIRSTTHSA